jgi:hypothetical protein
VILSIVGGHDLKTLAGKPPGGEQVLNKRLIPLFAAGRERPPQHDAVSHCFD